MRVNESDLATRNSHYVADPGTELVEETSAFMLSSCPETLLT